MEGKILIPEMTLSSPSIPNRLVVVNFETKNWLKVSDLVISSRILYFSSRPVGAVEMV